MPEPGTSGDQSGRRERSLHEVVVAASSLLDPTRLATVAVAEVRRLLGVEGASLTLWDADLGVLLPLAFDDVHVTDPKPVFFPGQGLIGEAFARDEPVIINDYRRELTHPPAWAEVGSGMAVPLHADGRLLGALSAQEYTPREHTEEELETLLLVAAQVGPALGTMRTLAQAQLRAAQARALAMLMRRGAELDDHNRLFRLVGDAAVRLLGADLVGLVLRDTGDGNSGWRGVVGARTDAWRRLTYGDAHPAAATIFGGELRLVRGPDGGVFDDEEFPFFSGEGVKVGVAIPLDSRERSSGALCLGWRFDVQLAEEQLEFGRALASFAGTLVTVAVDRAQRSALVGNAPLLLAAVDADGIVTVCAGAGAGRVGLGAADVGRPIGEVLGEAPEMLDLVRRCMPGSETVRGQAEIHGRVFDVSLVPQHAGRMLVATDVTERVRAEAELARRAAEDELTGLPNTSELVRRAQAALSTGPLLAVVADIRSFDQVNEAIGYDAADALLGALGARLARDFADAVAVGRIGGDEFAVVARGDRPVALAERVKASLEGFVSHDASEEIAVDARCGVASMTRDGDARRLLRDADSALQLARRGLVNIALWDEEVAERRRVQASLTGELRRALATRALGVAYQPILDLRDGSVDSVEALARWTRADGERVSPAVFVGLAEAVGRIGRLTEFVLEQALAEVAAGLGVPVCVNVSAQDVIDGRLHTVVTRCLSAHGLAPSMLTLELTESAAIESGAPALEALVAAGVRIAIDDFGRGWSSMELLKRLPATRLKLDRSYVAGAVHGGTDAAITHASVALGHALEMEVVAEGVEDAEVMGAMQRLGCDHVQGFHLARPMDVPGLATWLEARPVGSYDTGA